MSEKPILYSYWRSSCSWRIRAALELKGIEYIYKPVNLLKGEQNGAEFLKVNPLGKVPALAIDGDIIFESLAILEYLEEKYPNKTSLLPKDLMQRSKVRAIVLEIVAGIQPLQNLGNVSVIAKLCGNPEIGKAYAKKSIEDGLQKLEQILEKTSGKYAFGDSVTMADVCIVPQVYNAIRFGVNMDAYPVIKRIDASLQDIDAIKKSHPSQQPDAVNQ